MIEMNIKGAVYYKNKYISREQLMIMVEKIESTISSLSIHQNEVVGLYFDRNVEMLATIFAMLRLQIPFMPIDKKLPQKRIMNMITQANVQTIMSDEDIGGFAKCKMVNINKRPKDKNINKNKRYSKIAYVIFTSGSTGEPKGVVVGRNALSNFITSISDKLEIAKYKSVLCATNYAFDTFFLETIVCLLNGLNVVLTEELAGTNPRKIIRLIDKYDVECVQFTPSTLVMLREVNGDLSFLNNVKCILLGGEQLPEEMLKELKKNRGLKIYNMYGPTEATVWVSFKELTENEEVTIGNSIDNVEIFLLDDEGRKISDDTLGQICISGVALAEGYLNNKEKGGFERYGDTGEKIYKTGDLGRYNHDGEIVFIGRMDRQIKLRGFRIELDEIDKVLQKNDSVMFSHTFLDKKNNKIVTLCKTKEQVSTSYINNICINELPHYMIPENIIFVDKIPLLNNGKVNKFELKKMFEDMSDKIVNTKILKDITQIIYTKTEHIIYNNTMLATLKLNSIDYIRIIVEIEKKYGIEFEDKYLNPESFMYVYDIIHYVEQRLDVTE